jgi:hypothetical protein
MANRENLIGFRDLVAERMSYWLALKNPKFSKGEKKTFLRAVKAFDNIFIPDALEQLGLSVKPAEALSEWVKKALGI